MEKTTKISEILDNPEQYVGSDVKVEGMIVEVCARRGCWMEIAGDRQYEKIRIKVDDGVIVFPMEAKGRRATAEGVFTKIEMTMEQTLAYREHHAEEHGEEFDPASVTEFAVSSSVVSVLSAPAGSSLTAVTSTLVEPSPMIPPPPSSSLLPPPKMAAHRAMESLTLDREAAHLKDELMPRYAELVYYGFWFAPEREMLQALVDKSRAAGHEIVLISGTTDFILRWLPKNMGSR